MIDQTVLKDHVWDSVKETFETMIALPVERVDGEVDGEVELEVTQSMICVITFGGQLEGSFSACCAKACAEKIGKAMLMLGPDDSLSEAESCDAFGEMVNILIGGFKDRISEIAPDIQISIPSVFEGLDIQPRPRKGVSRVDITTTVDGMGMVVAVMYKSKE